MLPPATIWQAVALLAPDAWTRPHEKKFELYFLLSKCEYPVGNFVTTDALFDTVLGGAFSDLDGAKDLQVKLYQLAGKYDEGLAVPLRALGDFGVAFFRLRSGAASRAAERVRRPVELALSATGGHRGK
jgi:hypothetical protein